MSLIKDGPDIPEEVLHALRNDKLVLFCGAGISKQNGLPLFAELVEQVCEQLNIPIDEHPLLKEAKEQKKYDHILDLVEGNQDFSVERKILRKQVINILSKYRKNSTLVIHKALLDLSALPNKKGHRLVTTNMDQLFHKAGLNPKLVDIGPKLAPPRKQNWKNFIFLHGLIDQENDPEGKELILTKTDFGLAYLYDNWAARFMIQLFQEEFTILFIGYSINDPVMNYLMSAIASENRRKNDENKRNDHNQTVSTNKIKNSIYAFVGYKEENQKNDEQSEKEKWKSMGITPILYKINENHSLLYDTIKEWASLKRMGFNERKRWLREKLKCEGESPKEFKEPDKWEVKSVFDFLKIDKKLAKYFPQVNPHISLLKLVSELPTDEVTQKTNNAKIQSQNKPKLLDNLVIPKTLTRETELFALNTGIPIWGSLSKLENSVVLWLCKHLDKKELIHWIIEHNCILNISFKLHIQWAIERLEREEKQNKQVKGKIKLDKRQYLFWKTIIDINYCPRNNNNFEFLPLVSSLNKEYCSIKAQEFMSLLKPYIEFEKPFYYKSISESDKFYKPKIQIKLRHYPINQYKLKNESVLLKHAEDFSELLKKAMQKSEQFEMIQNCADIFYIQRPSIADHRQNKNFYTWTYLIDLARDSFDLAMKKNKNLAKFLFYKWQQYPYSIFYRLILYAITKYENLDVDEQLAIHLFKNSNTLWSSTCKYEVLQYLRNKKHSNQVGEELIQLIMQGPHRSYFNESVDDKQFKEYKERNIYERLKRLKFSGILFPGNIEKNYINIQQNIEIYNKQVQKQYNLSDVTPSDDDRDDFPFWHTGIHRRELMEYHSWTPETIYNDICAKSNMYSNTYIRQRDFQSLTEKNPNKAFEVLLIFESKNINSTPYWESFFYGVSSIRDIQNRKKWLFNALEKIKNYDNQFIIECLGGLTDSFRDNTKLLYNTDKDGFKKWWHRLWHLAVKGTDNFDKKTDIPMTALNSELGKLSQSIFDVLWNKYHDSIPRNDKIPEDIKNYFKTIVENAKKTPFVLYHFGTYLGNLWHLDKEWVLENIKPLLKTTKHKILSKVIWVGYLHNPKLDSNFLYDFKQEFFELFLYRKDIFLSNNNKNNHYLENIAGIFFVATGGSWSQNIFSGTEIKQLKQKIDVDMLNPISHQIWKLLKDSKDKSGHLWSEKIKPWINTFWPQQINMQTNEIAKNFSLAVLYAGHQLPNALKTLEPYIEENIQFNNDMITYHINKSCFDFETDRPENRVTEPHQLDSMFDYPKELLKLLNWNIPNQPESLIIKPELKKILDKIKNKYPEIEDNEDYKTLREKLE